MSGLWHPIQASCGGPKLLSLLFADDLILFAEASIEQSHFVKDCLDRFCEASGQKGNASKSRIYFSPNTCEQSRESVCEVLGMSSTEDLGRYLGVPTINGRITKATYRHVVERVERRLAGWKTKCLSLAGRITLIQSTISSIPAYTMQTAKLPRSTCDELDRKTRRFLWGGLLGRTEGSPDVLGSEY